MRVTQIVLFIMLTYIISSCSKKQERNNDLIPPLKIEITSNLADDTEIFEFIINAENSINNFSDNIEVIANEGDDLIRKQDSSLTMLEGLEVAKTMLLFYSNNVQLNNTIEEFEAFIETKKKQQEINDIQAGELSKILLTFKDRVNLLKQKYRVYYKR